MKNSDVPVSCVPLEFHTVMDIKVGTSFRHLWARILFGSEHFIGHMVDRYFSFDLCECS